jgi:putative ABC transport system permease protein
MKWWHWIDSLRARWRAIMRARRVEQDLNDELSFHMAMQTEAHVHDGVNSVDARRRARLEMGGMEQAKEHCRDALPLRWAQDFGRDIQYALRSLRREMGFTVVAVVTVALGVGANTAMFSVLNTYLLRPLPYQDPDRLVTVFRTSIHSQNWPHSAANFLDYRERNSVFDHMFAVNGISPSLAQPGELAERLQALAVTADFFPALGVPAALGRWFTREEDQPGNHRVVVLSDRLWQHRFGGDPNILGRKLVVDGENVQVIGVMPPGFDHPLLWGPVDFWRPLAFTPEQRQNRGNNYLRAFARLKSGVSRSQAEDAMVKLAAALSRETSFNQDESLRLEPLQVIGSTDTARNVMWLTFGLAGFVLLIGCANLANLQLVRTAARTREHAVRAALGAKGFRLLRQSLTESLVVAAVGGALSVVLAFGGVQLISRQLFRDLPGAQVTLDLTVFGFALLGSILTGMAFGTIPAWLASRADVNRALKEQGRGATTRSHYRARHALIVGEVAFAVVLLSGAGLLLRGIQRFVERDPGWRVDGLLSGQLNLQGSAYATPAQRLTFYDGIAERLRQLPGIQGLAISASQPPVWGFNSSTGVIVEGRPEPSPGQYPEAFFEQVSLDYFKTLGIRLLAGRDFTSADVAGRAQVVIINDATARRFWPNENPLGRRIARQGNPPIWLEIVGVVDDLRFPGSLSEPYTHLQAFRPLAQAAVANVNITLRTSSNPESLADPARRAVAEIDPAVPLSRLRSARSLVDRGVGNISLLGGLLAAFATLGLILAVIGVYGVTSYSVVQRTGEIGIRTALGAQADDLIRLILGKGAALVGLGAFLGLAGAYAVSRLMIAAIPRLPTWDPMAVGGVTFASLIVAIAACYVPARRATKVNPLVALRHE